MSERKRVGILISGRGSNMRALIEAARARDYPAEIAIVISNCADAAGLDYAKAHDIAAICVDHRRFGERQDFEAALNDVLVAHDVQLVCNAGFMRLLTANFVERWRDRQLNIHPSLLPAFKGLDSHRRVLEAGVRITGCTVHVVREAMDAGPIIAQAAVPVEVGDTEETLAERVLAAEHLIYPRALALLASGAVTIEGERAVFAERADQGNDRVLVS